MKIILLLCLNLVWFSLQAAEPDSPGIGQQHVRGIGGVFFKTEDPAKVSEWYGRHFGIDASAGYAYFLWRDYRDPGHIDRTVWTAFPKTSDYFGRPEQQFMISYIVDDLDGFLLDLKSAGISQVGGLEEYDYGRFAWILDVEGNKVELWEPPPASAGP